MKKMRLIVTNACSKNCKGCCNEYLNFSKIPLVENRIFREYDEIILTGGEPLLMPPLLDPLIPRLRLYNPKAKIYLYTSLLNPVFFYFLAKIDGVTLTIHTLKDLTEFWNYSVFISQLFMPIIVNKISLRLYVRDNIFMTQQDIQAIKDMGWEIKRIHWQKECPIPEGEELFRL